MIVTTSLDWDYFSISGAGVSNEVYLGTSPVLTAGNLLGVTTNTIWTPARLAPMQTYYWKVITRRGALSTPGPVWSFTTRGVHHFTWSSIVSPQMAINPFGVIVSARDEFNTVVSNFTQKVDISGLVGSPAGNLFAESFEDGNFNGWVVGAGAYTRAVTNSTSAAGSNSVTLIGGSSQHFNGLSYNLPDLRPESVKFSVRAAANDKYAGYVVLGDGGAVGTTAAWFSTRPDGTMGIYEDVVGPHAVPYVANQWYAIELVFDWDHQRIHYLRDGVMIESGIPFRSASVTALSTLHIYNFDNTQAWWDDFQIVSSNQVTHIAVTPTQSPNFVEGYWSGSMTVLTPATNMLLLAEDSQGNQGQSGRFDVSVNTRPALSVADISIVEGETGTRSAVFTVRLSPTSGTNVTVNYATSDGTATAGVDYVATSGELSFLAGQSAKTVSVTIQSDNLTEANEDLWLTLSNPFNALLSNSVARCVIWDDELPPNVYVHSSVGQPWNRPDNVEAMNQVFGTNWVEAYFETINPQVLFSSAIRFIFMEGSDDNALPMEAFMSTNSSRYTSWVSAGGLAFLNAAPNEGDGMSFFLGNTLNYPISNAHTGRVVLASHPLATGPFTPAGTTYSGTAFAHGSVSGSGLRTLIWDLEDTNQVLVAEESFGNGNAVMGGLTVPTYHAPQPNADNLRANLLAWASDPKPYIEGQDAFGIENDAGTTNLYMPITLSRPYGSNVTVNFGTAGSTATAGVDYFATNGTVTFPPGVTVVYIPIHVIGDNAPEQPEKTTLLLSSPVNGVILRNGVATIIDDDQPSVAFLRSNVGDPWANGPAYTNAMNAVFGATNWQSLFLETVNPGALFSDVTRFVYLEGSANTALELNNFLTVNRSLIQSWVSAGGFLFFNAAPTEGGDINAGFGVTINYPDSTRTGLVYRVTHPIANTPFSPVGSSWYGSSFGHATILGSGLYPLVTDITNSAKLVVAEKAYGEGNVVFGGLTTFTFHSPSVQASNLFLNILAWASNPKPYASIDDTWSIEPDSGTSNMFYTVRLNRSSTTNVSVTYNTSGNTATANVDYQVTPGTLTFPPGTTSLTVPVPIIGDNLVEGHEIFRLLLLSATNCVIVDNAGTGTIIDDDLPSSVYLRSSGGEPWASLANSNAMNRVFGVGGWQSLYLQTVNPATLFTPATKFIFIEGGQAGAAVLEAWLSTNSSALYSWVSAGGSAFINAAQSSVNTIYLGNGIYNDFTGSNYVSGVQSALPNHPVFAGPYTPVGTSYTGTSFAHGVLTGSGLLTLLTNTTDGTRVLAEKPYGNGTVLYGTMTPDNYHSPLANATNFTANLLAWGADPKPYVYVSNVDTIEGDSGTTLATFIISLSRRDLAPVSVNYATAGGSATSGTDFRATNGVAIIPPGSTSSQVRVAVLGDTVGELTETYTLNVSNPTNCVILDSSGLGSILNDDIFLATLPFSEPWESGLRPFWSVGGVGTSRGLITTSNTPYAGSYHLVMDSSTSGSFARNEATVNLATTGYTNAQLRFFAKGFNEEYDAPPPLPFAFGADFDGVAISSDGVWWFPVLGLTNLTSTYREYVANLDDTMELYGLQYTTPLYLRFVQYDNYPVTTDGVAFDNITVTAVPRIPQMVASNWLMVAESCAPGNGQFDPGERVTVAFTVHNAGGGPSENLTATLQAVDGVAAPSAPVSLGTVGANSSVTFPLTFTVTRSCGSIIVPTISLTDAWGTHQAKFPLRVGASGVASSLYANNVALTIPSSGAASVYPSTINVAGYLGTPSRVWVTLRGLSHTWPDDLDILLVSPLGQKLMLLSDVGGSADATGLTLNLFQGAPLPTTPLENGFFSPRDIAAGDVMAAPAPAGPYGTSLSVLTGANPNGVWSLYVVDDTSGDAGSLAGWDLHLESGSPSCCLPVFPVASAMVGNNFRLTFNATAGQVYSIEQTAALGDAPVWTEYDTVVGGGGMLNYDIPIVPNENRFFRLRLVIP